MTRAIVLFCSVVFLSAAPSLAAADVMTGIVDPYLRIQTSLADDTLTDVKTSADLIAAEAARLGAAGSAMEKAAKEVSGAADLNAARAAFGRLSDALMKYADTADQPFDAGLNVAYCPMVKKSWVQKGTKIANPYAGKQMLECGEIVKPVKGS